MKKKSIMREISIAHFHLGMLLDKQLEEKQLKIRKGQNRFLWNIYRNEGMSQKELGAYLHVEKATTAKAVQKLIEAGYIYKKEDEKDRRLYRLYMTEEGKMVIPELKEIRETINNTALANFSEEQEKEFFEFLQKFNENLLK